MGSSFQKFFILYQKRHRQSKMDRQCLFILNFQICSFMVEKRYLSGSFPFLIKQKSQKALISLTFWLVRSRGWENRTPTKGFGDPYHTIWPIPYKYILYTLKTTYMLTFPWESTSCVAKINWCTPRGSLRNSVAQCHLLRKCSVCTMNVPPQASLLRLIPVTSCPLSQRFGQALTRLVTVSSMHYCTSTSALSTSSSSRGFTSFEWDISS